MNTSSYRDSLLEDPELDEEAAEAQTRADGLREMANGIVNHGISRPEALVEAIAMYRAADATLRDNNRGRRFEGKTLDLALQCRLNAASVSLRANPAGSEALEFARSALDLDAENPHAALILAQVSPTGNRALWLGRAKSWALKRGDKAVAENADRVAKALQMESKAEGPLAKLQRGLGLIRTGNLSESRKVLDETLAMLDDKCLGGPLEQASRQARALGFDVLEALLECSARQGSHADAVRFGRRALALLEVGPETLFDAPLIYRREGLLCLSLGHAEAASVDEDPRASWHRASRAFSKEGCPEAEGAALLALGTRARQDCIGDPDAGAIHEEATVAFERAAVCFALARGKLARKDQSRSDRALHFAFQELHIAAALASLHTEAGNLRLAESVLESSQGLLDSIRPEEDGGTCAVEGRAGVVADWAAAAGLVGQLDYAVQALELQRRLAKVALNRAREMDSLASLAVIHRRRRDESKVEDVFAQLRTICPASEDVEKRIQEIRHQLERIGPASPQVQKALEQNNVRTGFRLLLSRLCARRR